MSQQRPDILSRKQVQSLGKGSPVGVILGMLVVLALSAFGATEYVARRFAFDPRLGVPRAAVPESLAPALSYLWMVLLALALLCMVVCLVVKKSLRSGLVCTAASLGYTGALSYFFSFPYLYAPHGLGIWLHTMWEHPIAQPVLKEGALLLFGLLLFGMVVIFVTVARPRYHKASGTYGSAHFGDGAWFTEASGQLQHGIPVGYREGEERLLYDDTGAHTFVCAPTGGGKTVGFAIPTLLSHEGSCFVLDIKGELYAVTGRCRRRRLRQQVRRLEPFGEGGDAFNPLDMIVTEHDLSGSAPGSGQARPVETRAFDDAKMISEMLVIKTGKEKEPFFVDNARQLLTGLILYVAYTHRRMREVRVPDFEAYHRQQRALSMAQSASSDGHGYGAGEASDGTGYAALASLAELVDAFRTFSGFDEGTGPASNGEGGNGVSADLEAALEALEADSWYPGMTYRTVKTYNPRRSLIEVRRLLTLSDTELRELLREMMEHENEIVRKRGAQFADMDERTFSSVVSTARSQTEFLDSPAIQRALERSTFDFTALKTQPTTVYLIIPIERLDNYSRFVRVMIACAQARLLGLRHRPPHPVLFLLDEFPRLQRFDRIDEGLSAHRSFGMQYLVIVQSVAQLEDIYGPLWRNFITNTTLQILWAANDDQACKFISELAGDHTVAYIEESENLNKQGKGLFTMSTTRGRSRTLRETRRKLIQPEEARTLDDRYCFVFARGKQPLVLRRPNYLYDQIFEETFDPNPYHEKVQPEASAAFEAYGKDFIRVSAHVFRDAKAARRAFLQLCVTASAEEARRALKAHPERFGRLRGHRFFGRSRRRQALSLVPRLAALGFQYYLAEGERRVRELLGMEATKKEVEWAFG